MKIIVTIIPTNLISNSILSPFYPKKPKKRIKFSVNWWSGNNKIMSFVQSKSPYRISIDFYQRMFLHVLVLIIVPCF